MLAGTLKTACCEVFGFDQSQLHLQSYKEAELDKPVELTKDNLIAIANYFGVEYDFDTHLRPHVGMLLETVRFALQYVGTEVLHPIDKNIHVKAAVKTIKDGALNVITDLRFTQEFDYFNDNYSRDEFHPFYIQNFAAEAAAAGDTHPSETQLKEFRDKCVKLCNNDNLSDFEALVANSVRGVL